MMSERRMVDDDLWLVGPEERDGLVGEEAIEGYGRAAGWLEDLYPLAAYVGPAAITLIRDARLRAEEAEDRHRRRRIVTPADVNGALGEVRDLIEIAGPEAFGGEVNYLGAKQAIAAAGKTVARAVRQK